LIVAVYVPGERDSAFVLTATVTDVAEVPTDPDAGAIESQLGPLGLP